MSNNSKFVEFKSCNHIWAVGSIHSNFKSFESVKKYILENFSTNDKIIFLGNVIGVGESTKETLSSVIDLRFQLMAKFSLLPEDVVFLRGAQEEMFLKLLQLHTAPNPIEILRWMYDHGVDKTIDSYGFDSKELISVSSQGTISINKWISNLKNIVDKNVGHREYFSNLSHAAFPKSKLILFVNRGVDITRPLSAQSDCFWWGYYNFSKLDRPYRTFKKIIRGYESSLLKDNNLENKTVFSLYKGPLDRKKIIAASFSESGKLIDIIESL
ncbi:MAG: hypothetical protein CFH19_00072 [Alphaproteobacteria bacterium MarineAlpha5_Bin9]|nr:MAG: hypothetical protein CFH19_00072 [Alphaproteobacteria bacterium MarineAlpha5_Bin9]|tara:strand:- start:9938 stop:10747 length:810 start_codon:yes stop_codon:yes gene_type:complete